MDQPTFADQEYQGKKRKTRWKLFLERMDGLIPWHRLQERIRTFYPKAGKGRTGDDAAGSWQGVSDVEGGVLHGVGVLVGRDEGVSRQRRRLPCMIGDPGAGAQWAAVIKRQT